MGAIAEVSAIELDEIIKASDRPVLVDFWAEWCGPCRPLADVLAALAEESDALGIVKVNIDEHPELAHRYSVLSVPTVIVFVEGGEAKRLVGLRPLRALRRDLEGFTAQRAE